MALPACNCPAPDNLLQLRRDWHICILMKVSQIPPLTRYSCAMHKWLRFALVSAVSANALAQAQPPATQSESAREQRRLELRLALQAQRKPEPPLADEQAPAGRHMTSEQQAEMRQQRVVGQSSP